MSNEIEKRNEESKGNTVTSTRKSERLIWVDIARGFIVFFLVLTLAWPELWKEGVILSFIFAHPGTIDTYITIYDVGTPAFFIIIGILYSINFQKRAEREGTGKAIIHVVIRYGLLLVLGFVIFYFVDQASIIELKDGLYVIRWDVIPALGLVGFVAIPFEFIKKIKLRLIVAYIWMIIYQFLLIIPATRFRDYAIQSIHGGFFGTLFTFSAIVVIASTIGEYLIKDSADDKEKYKNIGILALVNLIIGIILAFIPEFYANKRQATLSYGLICIGSVFLCLLIFVYIDKVKQKDAKYLQAFGRNPFLTYFVAELIWQISDLLILDGMSNEERVIPQAIIIVILVVVTSLMNVYLYKREKILRTEKAIVLFFIVTVILGVLLL